MRRQFLLALSATIVLAGCDQHPTDQPASNAKNSAAKITIGLDDNFPPMGFRDDKNELVGFDIDLAREAARRMGIAVDFKPIDWNAKEAELIGHRVDALWNGLTITERRKQNISFTAPYMQNHQIIIVRKDSPISNKQGLSGKVVGAQDGSSAVDAIEKDEETSKSIKQIKKYGDNVTVLLDLDAGRLDAAVLDEVVGRYYIAKKPGAYTVLKENFGSEDYGVGLRKEDTTLQKHLEQAIESMKKDGKAGEIALKWFGQDIIH
ncbi:MAG: amino acid ABC transporter substrate-binding protein [Lautropia sp.]|nr:amino acid ABC transporter substrate-binding protein [Lautropia sp.]